MWNGADGKLEWFDERGMKKGMEGGKEGRCRMAGKAWKHTPMRAMQITSP